MTCIEPEKICPKCKAHTTESDLEFWYRYPLDHPLFRLKARDIYCVLCGTELVRQTRPRQEHFAWDIDIIEYKCVNCGYIEDAYGTLPNFEIDMYCPACGKQFNYNTLKIRKKKAKVIK